MARRVSKADMKHTELQKAVLSMAGRYLDISDAELEEAHKRYVK